MYNAFSKLSPAPPVQSELKRCSDSSADSGTNAVQANKEVAASLEFHKGLQAIARDILEAKKKGLAQQ